MLKKIILFILFLNLNKIYSGSTPIKIKIENIDSYKYKDKLNENLTENENLTKEFDVKINKDKNKDEKKDEKEIKNQIIGVFNGKGYTIDENDITLNKNTKENDYWFSTIKNVLISDIMKDIDDKKNEINSLESDNNEFSKKIDDFSKCLEKNLKGNMFYSNYYNELEKYIDFLKKCKEALHDINEEDINNFKDSYLENKDDLFIDNIFKKFFKEYVFMEDGDIKKLKYELKKEFEDKFNKIFNENLTKININIKDNNVLKDEYKKKFENIQNKYKRGIFEFLSYCIILGILKNSFEQANIRLYNKIDGNFQLINIDENNDLFLERGKEYEIYVEFPDDFYKTIYTDKSIGTDDEKNELGENICDSDENDDENKDNSNKKQRGRCRYFRNCLKKNR